MTDSSRDDLNNRFDPRASVEELLLAWEEAAAPRLSPREFCRVIGVDDESKVAEFVEKAQALDFMSDFLSDSSDRSHTRRSAIQPGRVRVEHLIQVQEPLAFGGRSAIHRAEDETLGRPVALKTLTVQSRAAASNASRLIQEAVILGSLQHPGILPVYHLLNDENNSPCYTMPLIDGFTLQQAIADCDNHPAGRWNPQRQELLRRFIAVCQTLGYAHNKQIAHRDIKPNNILLGSFGETFLVDWGLAKPIQRDLSTPLARCQGGSQPTPQTASVSVDLASDSPADDPNGPRESAPDSELTDAGSSLGTPAYMSPEQARSIPDSDPFRSDIFNLGATLYAILTGRPPYHDDSLANVMAAAWAVRFPRPRACNPQIPPPLESICLKAMASEPDQRFGSPSEIAEEINRWFDDQPLDCHGESFWEKTSRWNRRHGRWIAASLLVSLLLLATITLAAIQVNGQKRRSDASTQLAWEVVNESASEIYENEFLKSTNLQPLRQDLLTRTLANYRRLMKNPADRRILAPQLGTTYLQSGLIRQELRLLPEARRDYKAALSIFDQQLERGVRPASAAENAAEQLARCQIELLRLSETLDDAAALQAHARVTRLRDEFPESSRLLRLHIESQLILIEDRLQTGARPEARRRLEQLRGQIETADVHSQRSGMGLMQARIEQLAALTAVDQDREQGYLESALRTLEQFLDQPQLPAQQRLKLARQYLELLNHRHELAVQRGQDVLPWLNQHKEFLQQIAIQFPGLSDFRSRQQQVCMSLAKEYRRREMWTQALQQFELADGLNAALDKQQPQTAQYLAQAWIDVGTWHRENGRVQESQSAFLAASGVFDREEIPLTVDTRRLLGQNHLVIGADQWMFGNLTAALDSFQQAESTFSQLRRTEPGNRDWVSFHATSQMAIALALALLDQRDQAITRIRAAIVDFRTLSNTSTLGDASDNASDNASATPLHMSYFLLAAVLERDGQLDEAERTRTRMDQLLPDDGEELMTLAETFAREAQLFGRGKQQFSATDRFYLERYHQHVIRLAGLAGQRGFSSWERLRNNPVFMPLFRYAQFRDLIGT